MHGMPVLPTPYQRHTATTHGGSRQCTVTVTVTVDSTRFHGHGKGRPDILQVGRPRSCAYERT